MTNQFQYHDDILHAFDLGGTPWMISIGRWSSEILLKVFTLFFGMDVVSMAFFNTLSTIFIIALMSLLIIKILRIDDPHLAAAVSGIIIVFPSIIGTLGYNFASIQYAIAYFLVALSVYIIVNTKWNSIIKTLIFVAFNAFATGIYQATIPFMLALICVYFLRCYFDEDNICWKNYFSNIFTWGGVCVASLLLYFIIAFSWVKLAGIEFSNYRNIRNWGKGSLIDYIQRIGMSYWRIIQTNKREDMYPTSIRFFYYGILILIIALACVMLYKTFRKSKTKALQCLILFIFTPLSINFIYVMCGDQNIRSLMHFAQIFIRLVH